MNDGEYSPQRATRVAAVASMGTLLTLVGFFASGGDASGAPSEDTAPTTSSRSTSTSTVPGTTSPSTSPSTSSSTSTSTTVAPCTNTYTVHSGDYWLLLAQEADVDVADLYSLNGAGPDTALFAGESICLPDGATVVTVAPATTPAATAAAPVVTAAQTTRASG